jgi:hypothetical protein
MTSRDAIVVMARRPVAGAVKTRLAAGIGDDAACRFYEAFLIDTLAACASVSADVIVSYDAGAEDARTYVAALAPGAAVTPQPDAPFGQRLAAGMAHAFTRGYKRVAIIGSDIPQMHASAITGAFALLCEADVVVAPTDDGGYYLLAATAFHPGLFEDIDWSSGRECAQTLAHVRQLGLTIALGTPTFDIDTVDDLHRLRMLVDTRGPSACPATANVLRSMPAAITGATS